MKETRKLTLVVAALAVALGTLYTGFRVAEAAPVKPAPAMAAPAVPLQPSATPAPAMNPATPAMKPAPSPAPVLAAPAMSLTPAPVAKAPATAPAPAMAAAPAKAPAKKMSGGEIADLVFKIVGGIASLIFTVLGGLGYMKWAKDTRFQKVLAFADQAFPAVEALAKKSKNEVDDKLVAFLKMIATSLKKAGLPELTDGEKALVKDVAAKKALAEKLKE
jgi:hypothetical protein